MAERLRAEARRRDADKDRWNMSDEREKLLTIVVIGLNEEARLAESLHSIFSCRPRGYDLQVIYVDSGSTDRSVQIATAVEGVEVLRLETERRSAARARNLGLRSAKGRYVQLVDGDSVIQSGWFDVAVRQLERNADFACVFGQCVEINPEQSIYMQVCGLDWHIPPGEHRLCGGNAMWRLSSIISNGYFDENLEAGEEPDLCYRVRHNGGKIVCIDMPMVTHDLQMKRFAQYWQRGEKTGKGYAQVSMRYRSRSEKLWLREFVVNFAEPAVWIVVASIGWLAHGAVGAMILLIVWWTVRAAQISLAMRGRGLSAARRLMYGVHCQFVRLPVAVGQVRTVLTWAMTQREPTPDSR
jgi:glycosyltransferase involved in cell wall biosynthesis